MLFLADEAFVITKQTELQKVKFIAKDQEQLMAEKPIKFNSRIIELQPDGITLTQEY